MRRNDTRDKGIALPSTESFGNNINLKIKEDYHSLNNQGRVTDLINLRSILDLFPEGVRDKINLSPEEGVDNLSVRQALDASDIMSNVCKSNCSMWRMADVLVIRLLERLSSLLEDGTFDKLSILTSVHNYHSGFPSDFSLIIESELVGKIVIVSRDIGYNELEGKSDTDLPGSFVNFDNEDWMPLANSTHIVFETKHSDSVFSLLNDVDHESSFLLNENYFNDQKSSAIEIITVDSRGGLACRLIDIEDARMSDETLKLHYGSDMPKYNESLVNAFDEYHKGVYMLYGEPGTGKTYYIRHIISELRKKGKRVILFPKNILANVEAPSFNNFMVGNFGDSENVFVIEDAESIIGERDANGHRTSIVSTLLNLSDGILNDIFKIQILLTFNTDLENIDKAFLRPERLIAKREFLLFEDEQAKTLADHLELSKEYKISEPKPNTLAGVYSLRSLNRNDILISSRKNKELIRKPVGFIRSPAGDKRSD